MPLTGRLVLAAYLSAIACVPAIAVAADRSVVAQDLTKARASGKVMAAMWTRRLDSYTLQVVLDRSRYEVENASVSRPEEKSGAQPTQGSTGLDRSSFFIGNTITNLRGLDPAFGCRTLALVDGRRIAAVQPDAAAPAQVSSVPQTITVTGRKPPVVQVWLLRADGTQILPISSSPQPTTVTCQGRTIADDVLYRFSSVDSAQAVAAAIRIGDEYYIEKLEPLEPARAGQ